MDLSQFTFVELNKLYFLLGIEYLKRAWWLVLIFVILYLWLKRK
jgi:hypothetical protein